MITAFHIIAGTFLCLFLCDGLGNKHEEGRKLSITAALVLAVIWGTFIMSMVIINMKG
jgi:hypothetical protein